MIARRYSTRIVIGGAVILALACGAALLPAHVHGAVLRMTAATVAWAMMAVSVLIPLGVTAPVWRRRPRLALTLWLAVPGVAALLIHGATREALEWVAIVILTLLWLAFFVVISVHVLWAAMGGPAALILGLAELLFGAGRQLYLAGRDIYRAKLPARAYWALGLGGAAIASAMVGLHLLEVRVMAAGVAATLAAGLLLLAILDRKG